MSDTIIKIDNVSKLYRLGKVGTGSFKQDLQVMWNKYVKRKNDPYYHGITDTPEDQVQWIWALKNINLEIKQGDSLGIIGSNGSGKSTLLKILSRIVQPTEGRITGKGRVSSLLEVGTGFHGELTGRENIFISGNILGMSSAEVRKKFDEIVQFSGVERFIDTPVKRYSSGMYVRLAFAVAAHLEPDILIVDEVLAVGDAEFQKKCLAKMYDSAVNKGRTVIFVSHNIQAVNSLCKKAAWLNHGKLKMVGDTRSVTDAYMKNLDKGKWIQQFSHPSQAPGNDIVRILSFELIPKFRFGIDYIDIRIPIDIKFRIQNFRPGLNLAVSINLFYVTGECVFELTHCPSVFKEGILEGECSIPGNFLNNGNYYLSLICVENNTNVIFQYEQALHFEVADFRDHTNMYGHSMGFVRPDFPLTLRQARVAETVQLTQII